MSTEQAGAQAAQGEVALTEEQIRATWAEVRAEREAAASGRTDQHPAPEAPSNGSGAPEAAAGNQPAAIPAAGADARPADPPAPKKPATADELAAELARTRAEMERRVRQSEGHAGNAMQAVKRLQAELEAERARAAQRAQAPTQEQVDAAAKSSTKWTALKSDYPEWAEAIEERFGTQGARGDEEAIRRVEQKAAQDIAAAREEARAARTDSQRTRVEFVEMFHPGWEDTCRSKEFKEWMGKAGDEERALAESDRPADAVRLLNRFKFGADAPPANGVHPRTAADTIRERQERLQQAVTPARTNATVSLAKSPEDMTNEEYWRWSIEQRKRQQGAR